MREPLRLLCMSSRQNVASPIWFHPSEPKETGQKNLCEWWICWKLSYIKAIVCVCAEALLWCWFSLLHNILMIPLISDHNVYVASPGYNQHAWKSSGHMESALWRSGGLETGHNPAPAHCLHDIHPGVALTEVFQTPESLGVPMVLPGLTQGQLSGYHVRGIYFHPWQWK